MSVINLAAKRKQVAAEKALTALGYARDGERWLSPLETVIGEMFRYVAATAMTPLPDPSTFAYEAMLRLQMAAAQFTALQDATTAVDGISTLEDLGAAFDGRTWSAPARPAPPELTEVGDVIAAEINVLMCEAADELGPDDPLTGVLDDLLQTYETVRYSEAEREQRRRSNEGVMPYRDFVRFRRGEAPIDGP
jgi:hypothetical protein